MNTSEAAPPAPWWKFGHVWLVIAGPAVVVVAGFATLWIALRMPDPVLDAQRTLTPALQGRNHAATPRPVR